MSPVRFPNIASLWTPKLLPNLIAWYDADDDSTITLNSGKASDWNDKSGSGNHVTQATADRQPTLLTANQNGRDALDFMWTVSGGAGRKYMQRGTNFTNITGSKLSVFITTKPTTNWNAYGRAISLTASASTGTAGQDWNSTNRIAAILRDASNSNVHSFYNSVGTNTAAVTVGSWSTIGVIVNGTSHTLRVNGSSTTTTLGTTPSFNINTLTIGQNTGEVGTTNDTWNSVYGEILICNTNLGTTDRDKIEGYLAWRWGIAGSLAAGHPYKNYPPYG